MVFWTPQGPVQSFFQLYISSKDIIAPNESLTLTPTLTKKKKQQNEFHQNGKAYCPKCLIFVKRSSRNTHIPTYKKRDPGLPFSSTNRLHRLGPGYCSETSSRLVSLALHQSLAIARMIRTSSQSRVKGGSVFLSKAKPT